MIRENDRVKFWWDFLILCLAIFNSIFIPLTLSFEDINETMKNSIIYVIIDNAANVIFFIDIYLGFNTSYYNPEGEEIFDKKMIRSHYLKGTFIIDFVSTVPFDTIVPGTYFKLLNMLKIIRV